MATQKKLTRAMFTASKKRRVDVHFNPASLVFTVENTVRNKGKGDKKKQFVAQRTGKLSMELIFDTTDTGADVRTLTGKLAAFMKAKKTKKARAAESLKFQWGTYSFDGMLESYKETIDFFSMDGVPLRATVNVTLAGKDQTFEPAEAKPNAPSSLSPDAVEVPAAGPRGTTDAATRAGSPQSTRRVGSNNGVENLRFPATSSLVLTDSVPLRPPAAFASAGVGVDAALEFAPGAAVGARASAGVAASAGAFGGLRRASAAAGAAVQLDVGAFLEADASADLSTGVGAEFGLGGQATVGGAASLSTNVGAAGDLEARIQFDDE